MIFLSRVVANYVFWRFIRNRINNLDDRFQEAKQTFYYILFGREKSPSRWKNCVSQVNSNMGMAVGSIFVRKYFDEQSKNDVINSFILLFSLLRRVLTLN
jgi:membrane metallo-endopeptidase-like protein 1